MGNPSKLVQADKLIRSKQDQFIDIPNKGCVVVKGFKSGSNIYAFNIVGIETAAVLLPPSIIIDKGDSLKNIS